jgi:hypothetical protein
MRANLTCLAILSLALALLAAPFTGAHSEGGGRNYCEDPSEWQSHDYGYGTGGLIVSNGADGNIAGDCDGDGVPADFDGHIEFAYGGAYLSAGDSPSCNSERAHHPRFGPFSVSDLVNGETVSFFVAADFINAVPPTDPAAPNCGDLQMDKATLCVGTCTVTFPEGLDGMYVVFVGSLDGSVTTSGHVATPEGSPGGALLGVGLGAGTLRSPNGEAVPHPHNCPQGIPH